MDTKNYPDFNYRISQLSAFLLGIEGLFTISLKDGQIIHFTPKDTEQFKQWLTSHHIRNIKDNNSTKSIHKKS